MAVTTVKATVIENVFKNFYDVINAISGVPRPFPVFPGKIIDASADYPIVVINPPEIESDTFTFGKGVIEGTIMVEIYTTAPKDTDQFHSDIWNGIEVEKDTLATNGLRQVNMESSFSDMFPHGDIKIFIKTLPFTFKFYYTKTNAF